MRQFTFWNKKKQSPEAHEHATLRFCDDGTILKLSRDKTKAVRPVWIEVGTWHENTAWFIIDSYDLRVAGTHLWRNGWAIHGVTCFARMDTVGRETDRVTNPETLMGRERGRSLNLGSTASAEKGASKFGKRFTCDVAAMRAAILKRNS